MSRTRCASRASSRRHGGFTIREAGIFNDAGELIAIASYPPIYKPTPGDGVTVEEYIRILLHQRDHGDPSLRRREGRR
jgi:hypothetical protein